MPLKLSLKPGETFVVNGAVVRNGERRGVLLLETQARVLREKDIMQPEEAVSPARRAYFAVMQMYLTGSLEGQDYDEAVAALAELISSGAEEKDAVIAISEDLIAGNIYRALGGCRKLINAESEPVH